MNFKKGMAIALSVGIVCTAMAGCSQKKPVDATTKAPESKTQAQNTTTSGELASTTAPVTTKPGETTTASTTTTKKVETTVVKQDGTTKTYQIDNGTTAIYTTTKPTTTQKQQGNNNGTTKPTTKPGGSTQNTTKPTTTVKTDNAVKIALVKNGGIECSNPNVSIGKNGIEGVLYIEKGGDYVITSKTDTWHGQIVIKLPNTEKAEIRFENVDIDTKLPNAIKILDTNISSERSFIEADVSSGTSGDTDNALQDQMKEVAKIDKAPNVDLSFPTGTKSTFLSRSNTMSGVIYNESKLTIKGNGAVDITSAINRNNAICSTKSVTFKNVSATLETPNNTATSSLGSARGIFSFSKVYVESGRLKINSNGDGIRCEGFNSSGGTTIINSSASDGIDADDSIVITGGTVNVRALEKSAFKVRRVNNQENLNAGKSVKANDCITKASHTFRIDGGTVMGEGKNMTAPKKRASIQQLSTQPSIYCRSTKAAGSEEAKMPLSYTIKCGSSKIVASTDSCIKFLYSSPSLSTGKTYTVTGHNKKDYGTDTKVVFTDGNGKVGDCKIVAS